MNKQEDNSVFVRHDLTKSLALSILAVATIVALYVLERRGVSISGFLLR